jgi:propanediol dehydratase large subunit
LIVTGKPSNTNRWRRFQEWDERPLRLDRFAADNPEAGFAVFSSPYDPKPGVVLKDGRVVSMDGKAEVDFDILDAFIARHHLDPDMVEEAMAMDPKIVARMLVDVNVPRSEPE